jgi:hypothetical protein
MFRRDERMSEPSRIPERLPFSAVAARRLRALLACKWTPDVAYVPLAIAMVWSLLATRGVPDTHDGLGVDRLETFRRAFLAGDAFPVWTVFGSNYHGSPHLLLYHRLYGQLFGALALLTGPIGAMKISVPLLLVAGGAGMRRLCELHGVRRWIAWLAGAFVLSATYATTDWFVRGAIAELAAFMILPWCFYCLDLFRKHRASALALAFVTSLLFYAHMVMFFYFGFVLVAALAAHLFRAARSSMADLRRELGRIAAFGALVACGIGPYAMAVSYAMPFVGVATMGIEHHKYRPLIDYLFDPHLSWWDVPHPNDMAIEVGRWLLLPLAVLLVLLPSARASVRARAGALCVVALFFVLLQHHAFVWVLETIPGAQKIQFPLRLVIFLIPVAALCLGLSLEQAKRSPWPGVGPAALALCVVALVAQMNLGIRDQRTIEKSQIPRATEEAHIADLGVWATWEWYLPEGRGRMAPEPFFMASQGCRFSSPELTGGREVSDLKDNVHFTSFSLTMHGSGCMLRWNQYYSPLVAIGFDRPGEARMSPTGTTLILAPVDGTVVHVRERTILELARRWVAQKIRRRA